jgi:endo-1,3(4)-beta-glucanase
VIRRRLIAVPATVVLLVVTALVGCTAAPNRADSSGPGLDAATGSVPHRSVAPMPTARLAAHLIPPTNRWFSGLVFGNQPQPVFPLPLSFGLTGSGFALGVPTVTTGADTISGGYSPAITVGNGSVSSVITAYDAASVTIEQKDASGSGVGSIVIAEGSPVVSYTALHDTTLTLGTRFTGSGHVRTVTIGATDYGLISEGSLSGTQLRLSTGQTAQLFAIPNGTDAQKFGSHVSAITGVSVAYTVGKNTVTTTLKYHSAGSTAIAAMPHQQAGLVTPSDCSLGSYPSVYGTLALCSGSTLSWTSKKVTPDASLTVSTLSSADTTLLSSQLGQDLASTAPLPTDTYFGGKALYRLANLLTLARALGDSSAATVARTKLDEALTAWTDPHGCSHRADRCFVYDPTVKGVVGLAASFGSDQFNDHHFHYGYFLYAAAVAAKDDPSITSKLKPVMDLLAADIGTPGTSARFPTRRVFDAYAGHSWASGYAPFADGNNQESSSEAVDAWNGLGLWADATGNQQLSTEATWMLSAEAASARAYWTNFPTTASVYSGYQHSVIGINWGSKRDFATWFSADANAKLGIQLIPMSPASGYLGGDPTRIARNIAEAAPSGFTVQFGDYLLMYSALEGSTQATAALATARTLPAQFIDDANSRSYLMAWIMSRQ